MASRFKDYYETLQIPRTATDDEIKRAYRRLARQYHPDLHPEKEKHLHTGKMQEINEAYAVLASKENRAKYDQFGEHWKEGPPPAPPHSGASRPADEGSGQDPEAFSDFFRNMFRSSAEGAAPEDLYPSELDMEAALDLSLSEAVLGTEKNFSLMTAELCKNCRGTGRTQNGFCPVCGGVGEMRRPREIKTRIPPGLTEGGRLRLRGQGGERNGKRGDLYLQIHLLPDPAYKIEGSNLERTLSVFPWQAALGAELPVPTLDGTVRLKIAKGTHTGHRLRLAGKGLGKPGARGDLFIRIEMDLPNTLSPKVEALFKQMEEDIHAAR